MAKAHSETKSITASCRACHTRIRFNEQPALYDIVTCPECEEEFEVIGLLPIRLDWPSDLFDDDEWSYNDDDDDLLDK